MTPTERAALGNIGLLIIQAQEANDIDLAKAALDKAVRQILKLGKPQPFDPAQDVPWQPKAGRYYLVDAPRGNGAEITPAELRRLVEALGPGDEELREKLRTL